MTIKDGVTENAVHGDKPIPERKERVELPTCWLIETAKLAMSRGVSIMVSPDGDVFGLGENHGVSVQFPTGVEGKLWVEELLKFSPTGVSFPLVPYIGDRAEARKALRPYANFPADGAVGWLDHTSGVVHLRNKGVQVRSSTVKPFSPPVLVNPKFVGVFDIDFSDVVSREMVKLLVSSTSKDESRPMLARVGMSCYKGSPFLFATNGRLLAGCYVEDVPEHFAFDPALLNLADIVRYEFCESDGAFVRRYTMRDGVVITEKNSMVFPKVSQVVEEPLGYTEPITLKAEVFQGVMKQIAHLGLEGGNICFEHKLAKVVEGGGVFAEFETSAEMGDMCANFNIGYMSQMAAAGFDLTIVAPDAPALCRSKEGFGIVMPLRDV